MAVRSFTVKRGMFTVSAIMVKFRQHLSFISNDDARSIAVDFASTFRNRQLSGINSLGRRAKPLKKGYAIFKRNFGRQKNYTYSRKIGYTKNEWQRARSSARASGRRFGTTRTVQAPARVSGGVAGQRGPGGKPIRDLFLTGEMWATFAVTGAKPSRMAASFGKGRGARFGKGKALANERIDPFLGFSPPEIKIIVTDISRGINNRLGNLVVRA